jgi:hypothetical protein
MLAAVLLLLLLLLLAHLRAPAVHWWPLLCPCGWRQCGWCQGAHPCSQGEAAAEAQKQAQGIRQQGLCHWCNAHQVVHPASTQLLGISSWRS